MQSAFARRPRLFRWKKEVPSVGRHYGFTGAVVSDVGCVRAKNEDNYILGNCINRNSDAHSQQLLPLLCRGWQFAGVFDGMGGGEKGELASRITAESLLQAFGTISERASKAEIDRTIRRAFQEANNAITTLRRRYQVLGTTGTILCANRSEFKLYHLGDSRGYLFRENALLQLTEDQTLFRMKQSVGLYREEDPEAAEDQHKLLSYIGCDQTGRQLKPSESSWIPLEPEDRVLLCSDGLTNLCSGQQMEGILRRQPSPDFAAAALTRQAIENGGTDNVTCMVLSFP